MTELNSSSEIQSLDRRRFLQLGTGALIVPGLAGCGESKFTITPDSAWPQGPYGAESTAEMVTEGVDLAGKLALVTGCNSGLGLETMRVLALRGAQVIGTGRTLEKARIACESVAGNTTPVALELSDFESVVECARTVQQLGRPLDILVCNAGINTFQELELVNGIEKMFVVNHLGHFVLVNQLMTTIQAAAPGRIVHVGSASGYGQAPAVGIDFNNLRGEGAFDAGQAYGRSKLANALFSLELSRRWNPAQATSNVIHPGLVQTNIARTAPTLIRGGFNLFGGLVAKTPEQGAATQTYVATAPALAGVSGAYFEDCNPVVVTGPQHLNDTAMAEQLWEISEEMTAGYLV
jgi:NAD(P)-dependent dehydrogenase (short-subunit alcohol dehydrogenase family)